MKRQHTRWDRKREPPPPGEEDMSEWQDWRKSPTDQPPQERNMDAQAPLDYSTECRNMKEADNVHETDSNEERSDLTKSRPDTFMPPHWPMYPNYPPYPPGTSRNSSMSYPTHSSWQHPEYYMDHPYNNMKWWPEQRQSNNQFPPFNQYNKKDKKGFTPWIINRQQKDQSPFYNNYNKNHFDKAYLKENKFQQGSFPIQKNKFKPDSHSPRHSRNHNPDSKYPTNISRSPWNSDKDFNNRPKKKTDYNMSKFRKGDKFQSVTKQLHFPQSFQKRKIQQAGKSSAEKANSKAFSVAAKKLRQTFLAVKKGKKRKDFIKLGKGKGKLQTTFPNNNYKPVPTDINCETEVWRSFGSKDVCNNISVNITNLSTPPRNISDNDSVFTVDSDSESEASDITSISDLNSTNQTLSFINKKRKRHYSENCIPSPNHMPLQLRIRSQSACSFKFNDMLPECNNSDEEKNLRSTIIGKVKGLVVEQLQKVDKDNSQVKTTQSKKLKSLMETLNNISQSHFAEKLFTERMKITSDSFDERVAQVDVLSDDVVQQVKEILEMEAKGKGSWDEISLSIVDLINGSSKKSQSSFSYDPNQSDCLEAEIQILTPPPKTPTTMITLADSDTDFHHSLSANESPLLKDSLNTSISPEMSFMTLSSSPQKGETSVFNEQFQCESESPTIKRNLSNTTHQLPKISTLLDDDENNKTVKSHLEKCSTEKEEDRKVTTPLLPEDELCNINITSPLLKVKEERPSPISECGICMHSARSPHTPQCGFPYGMASSPVPLISGPRSLPASTQRPVPRLPSDLSVVFKREKPEERTFVSLENIDRPSSEERPKNPAPPDTTSNEPPSPLPIPSPQATLHPPGRQIVFSDSNFTEPPRPPPPPPLEHSPRIKFERQGPNSSFTCYCMRNQCGREHSDFHRSVPRRSSHSQICEGRGTHLYKMEAPYLPNNRPQTPQSMLNLFAIPAVPPRCIIPNNSPSTSTNIVPTREPSTVVNIAVQTDFCQVKLVDKSTSVDAQSCFSSQSHVTTNGKPLVSDNDNCSNIFFEFDNLISEVRTVNSDQRGISFQQRLTDCEDKIFNFIFSIDKKNKELNDMKTKVIEILRDLSKLRRNRSSDVELTNNTVNVNMINIDSQTSDDMNNRLKLEASDNMSIVSSSQEVGPMNDYPLNSYDHTEEIDGERCTSTSRLDPEKITEIEDSNELDTFVKEELMVQQFETRTLCAVHEESVLSFEKTTQEFHLPLSSVNNNQSDDSDITENDQSAKIESSDDIIIMGDGSHRKMGIFSPLSPKTRNSSGSEHGYSLRSRGPPSDSYDYNSDSNLVIKENGEIINGIICSTPKRRPNDDNSDNKTDIINLDSSDIIVESCIKKKRKRKTKKVGSSKKKQKKSYDFENLINLVYNSHSCKIVNTPDDENVCLIMPEQIESSILTIKIAGKYIFAGCTDSSVRVYDIMIGKLTQIYADHSGAVTSLLVLGEESYISDLSHFRLITGSEDRHIRIFDGKTGNLSLKLNATEPITCLEYQWKYVFIGTEGGCCIKWNLKDKKLGEKIQFCPNVINCILPHTEGSRRVLVVAAKGSLVMIRDAMSGLHLRSLEFLPFNIYTAIFDGNILYVGGADKKIYIYDFCSGAIKGQLNVFSSISSLLLHSNNIIATCYDGFVRIINLPKKELTHTLRVESSHKMFTCSFLYKNQIILGNKYGEIVSCNIPTQ